MWEGSDDAVLGQLMQLQVIEGLPRANDGDVCNKTTIYDAVWPTANHRNRREMHFKSSPVPKPSIPGISSPNL